MGCRHQNGNRAGFVGEMNGCFGQTQKKVRTSLAAAAQFLKVALNRR